MLLFLFCPTPLFSKALLFHYGPIEEGFRLLWSRETTVKSGFNESLVFVYDLFNDAISDLDFIV